MTPGIKLGLIMCAWQVDYLSSTTNFFKSPSVWSLELYVEHKVSLLGISNGLGLKDEEQTPCSWNFQAVGFSAASHFLSTHLKGGSKACSPHSTWSFSCEQEGFMPFLFLYPAFILLPFYSASLKSLFLKQNNEEGLQEEKGDWNLPNICIRLRPSTLASKPKDKGSLSSVHHHPHPHPHKA